MTDAIHQALAARVVELERQNRDLVGANNRYLERARAAERAAMAAGPDEVRDATRYRWLRARDLEEVYTGGVFIGLTPENVVINGVHADAAVDAAMAAETAAVECLDQTIAKENARG
jgi:hypothetical protein